MRITATRLPGEISTLYAELLEQLVTLEATRSIGNAEGTFVTKNVKGGTYVYFQYSVPGARPRQAYVGPRTPELEALVARYGDERARVATDREAIERLGAALRAAGLPAIDSAAGRVLHALAESGVFQLGGVLVGTHAFLAIGNLLGVRWEHGLLRTQDIDIAAESVLAVAVPELKADVPSILESLNMGFLPVPGLSPVEPSTSFKVRGRSLRLDLLTPARRTARGAVPISRLGAAAAPLPFLDYLLEETQLAVVIDGGGTLVRVPQPARFALHKVLVAENRPAAWHSKREKDLRQAAALIEVLAEDRPGDLAAARRAIERRGPTWRRPFERGCTLLERTSADAKNALEGRHA